MIAEYLASSWPFILPPALFIAGIAVGVKWHRAHVRKVNRDLFMQHPARQRRRRARLNQIQRSADAYARESIRNEG